MFGAFRHWFSLYFARTQNLDESVLCSHEPEHRTLGLDVAVLLEPKENSNLFKDIVFLEHIEQCEHLF